MSRKTIPFYFCKSRVPLVVFRLRDDKPLVAVVDTGSEVTMFDTSMEDCGLSVSDTEDETSFVGVNGESDVKSLRKVNGLLSFKTKDGDRCHATVEGILYDMTGITQVFRRRINKDIRISAILGSDFLKKNSANIDYRDRTLAINCQ